MAQWRILDGMDNNSTARATAERFDLACVAAQGPFPQIKCPVCKWQAAVLRNEIADHGPGRKGAIWCEGSGRRVVA